MEKKNNLTEKEQKAADYILGSIENAEADDALAFSTAYKELTQGISNRIYAENSDNGVV